MQEVFLPHGKRAAILTTLAGHSLAIIVFYLVWFS
jgi:hypothetical protein